MLETYKREVTIDDTAVNHRAGNLIGGDFEARVKEELQMCGISVGKSNVGDLPLLLKALEMRQIVKVGIIRVVPSMI